MLAVDDSLMECTYNRSERSALNRDPKTVEEAMSLMRRCFGHQKALAVERRMRTLALEDVGHVAPQVEHVKLH